MWAYLYKKCVKCGLDTSKHTGGGTCLKCRNKENWLKKKKEMQINPKLKKAYNAKQLKWIKEHREYYRGLKKLMRKNPQLKMKKRAQDLLNYYIKTGKIKKKIICENCKGKTKIEAHHPDYNFPLKVNWLCQICHQEWHRHNKAIVPKYIKSKFDPTKI
jgi:hypothetical protein